MKKYIRVLICMPFTLLKFCFIKVFHFNSFLFHPFSIFSVNSEVTIENKGKLRLGKLVRARGGSRLRVRPGGKLFIGSDVFFNCGCIITAKHSVTIGDGVEFGPNVLIYDHDHDFRCEGGIKSKQFKCSEVLIGDNC